MIYLCGSIKRFNRLRIKDNKFCLLYVGGIRVKKIYMPSGRKGIFKIIIITAVTLCLMAAFTGCSKGGAEQAENKDGYVYVPEYKTRFYRYLPLPHPEPLQPHTPYRLMP